jgi:hypothetical protein
MGTARILPLLLGLLLLAGGCESTSPPEEPLPEDDLRVIHRGGQPLPETPEEPDEPEAEESGAPVLRVGGGGSPTSRADLEASPEVPVVRVTGGGGRSRGGEDRRTGIRHALKESSGTTESGPVDRWPGYEERLSGPNLFRIVNRNDFSIRVGLRTGGGGLDFLVDPARAHEVRVPDGTYSVFFQYSVDPEGIYRGEGFTLSGHGLEMQVLEGSANGAEIRRVN